MQSRSAHALCLYLALLLSSSLSAAQLTAPSANPPAPASSPVHGPPQNATAPTSAYAETLQPLTDVRSDMANWSDIELAAYAATVTAAAEQCTQLQRTPFEGDELLALARLCSLGRQWPSTYSAARRYTRDAQAAHRIEGFALLLQADMNLQSWAEAIGNLQELHATGPYTSDKEEVFGYAVRTMEINAPNYALQAALMRQSDLLPCLDACTNGPSRAQAEAEAWHTLTLLQEQHVQDDHAALAELQQALLTRERPLPSNEQEVRQPPQPAIQQRATPARRQYESLGKPLPAALQVTHLNSGKQPQKFPAKPHPTLYILLSDKAPGIAKQIKAIDTLRTRLQSATNVVLLLADCTDPAHVHGPDVNCAKASQLADLGWSNAPLFLFQNIHGNLTWNVTGTPSWLQPGSLAELLVNRASPGTSTP